MTRQYAFPLPIRESMEAEDFLISPANEEAVRWLLEQETTSWSAHAFILWGAEGSGKTHLLSLWTEKTKAARLKAGDAVLRGIVEKTQTAPAFALDEADSIAGDPEKEEWLQHFFNATQAASLPFLMTAAAPPAQWGLKLRDIETRLKSCPTAQLHQPDDLLMRGLLLKQFKDRQLLIETGVVDYLATRLERTGTAARRAVEMLDRAALEESRKISIPFAQKILGF